MTQLFTPWGKVVESPSMLSALWQTSTNSSTDHIGSNAIGGRGTYPVALVAFLFTFSFLVSSFISSIFLSYSCLPAFSCSVVASCCSPRSPFASLVWLCLSKEEKKKKKEAEKSDDSSFCELARRRRVAFYVYEGGEGRSVVIDCDGFFSIIRRSHSDGGLDQRRLEVWSGPCLFEKGRCGTI